MLGNKPDTSSVLSDALFVFLFLVPFPTQSIRSNGQSGEEHVLFLFATLFLLTLDTIMRRSALACVVSSHAYIQTLCACGARVRTHLRTLGSVSTVGAPRCDVGEEYRASAVPGLA